MKVKVAAILAGIALLSATPARAQNAVWQRSTHTPVTQASDFEVQDVGFKRKGFRRRGFRRGRFRRSGLRRGQLRRGGFRRDRFRRGRLRHGGFKHSFGRRGFRGSFGHPFGFRRSKFGHSFGSKRGIFFNRGHRRFGRIRRFDKDRKFSNFNEKSLKEQDKLFDPASQGLESDRLLIESLENQSPEIIDQPLDEASILPIEEESQTVASEESDSVTFVQGETEVLDPADLLSEGIQEASPEELLGIELELNEVSQPSDN